MLPSCALSSTLPARITLFSSLRYLATYTLFRFSPCAIQNCSRYPTFDAAATVLFFARRLSLLFATIDLFATLLLSSYCPGQYSEDTEPTHTVLTPLHILTTICLLRSRFLTAATNVLPAKLLPVRCQRFSCYADVTISVSPLPLLLYCRRDNRFILCVVASVQTCPRNTIRSICPSGSCCYCYYHNTNVTIRVLSLWSPLRPRVLLTPSIS